MLTVKDLHKSYQVGKTTYEVLKGVSLTVEKGEFVAVMGPSGSGKTTLLNCISCYIPINSGEIMLGDRQLANLSEDALAKVRNRQLGFVFQDFLLLDGLTVRENILLPAIIGGAVPALWGGLLLILLFSRGTGLIGVFPSQGFPQGGWSDFGSALMSLVLPACSVGIIVGAGLMRYTRSALGGLASSGYIDMAMSCGMTRRQAVLRVGLRLAMPQLVSVIGLTFAEMVTGVMVIENLFALPGIGNGLVTDVGNRDLIAVQSELFMLAAFFLLIGLLVDLLHRVLDPRLKSADDVTEVNA